MMFDSAAFAFSVSNFKAFRTQQRIPVRPITLLFGPNSAGKSSAIQSLLLLAHLWQGGRLDTDEGRGKRQSRASRDNRVLRDPNYDGYPTDLGNFDRYATDPESEVELTLELPGSQLSSEIREWLRDPQALLLRLRALRTTDTTWPDRIKLSLDADDQTLCDGEKWRAPSRAPKRRMSRRDPQKTVPLPRGRALSGGPNLTLDRLAVAFRNTEGQAMVEMLGPTASERQREFPWLSSMDAIERLLDELATQMAFILGRTVHIGPLRQVPDERDPRSQRSSAGEREAYHELFADRSVRERLNAWLTHSGRLHTPYEVRVHRDDGIPTIPFPDELEGQVAQALQPVARAALERYLETLRSDRTLSDESLDDVDAGSIAKMWAGSMVSPANAPLSQSLRLFDARAEKLLRFGDVGVGLSQILPVLVMAYGAKQRTVSVEQPELHLHPALQAELGDAFIESAKTRGNTWLIETHSEHLLLRIMRRIREQHEGRASSELPPITNRDVSVVYIERVGDRSVIREMPLDERGDLLKPWPGGFFEEGFNEVFS